MRVIPIIILMAVTSFAGVIKTICASGCDYTTVQACEDNFTKSYAGVGKDTCYINAAGTYTGVISVGGQTNLDANNHIVFLGPAMTGILGDAAHAIVNSTASSASTILFITGFHEIRKLEITNSGTDAAPSNNGVFVTIGADLVLDKVIISCTGNQSQFVTTVPVTARNIICLNNSAFTGRYSFWNVGSTAMNVSNFIGYSGNSCVYNQSGTSTFTNGYCYAATGFAYDQVLGTLNRSYVSGDDATATGTGSVPSIAPGSAGFASIPTNLKITASSILYNVGTNLSGQYTTDIVDSTWTNWSIAANDPSVPAVASSRRGGGGILWRMGMSPRGR